MSEFTISKIEISGFRGFTTQQEIAFGKPLILIYGDNRNGKSSIINAIEWCLFGSEVAAIKYGEIRERDAWEVKNLNSPICHVQCEFQTSDGKTLTARRTYKTPRTSDLSYEIKGGEKSTDEKKLQALLRISPNDFVSSVHLHPEIVRSLIIAKPKERKEAIDRLLGLSEPRDMVDAFASEKPSGWGAELDQSLALLDAKLTAALSEKQKTIKDESAALESKGIKPQDLTAEGARAYAAKVRDDLQQFANTYHLAALSIAAPADFAGVQQFLAQLPTAIQKLRSEHPILADQGKHRVQKSKLEGLRSSYASQQKVSGDADLALTTYPEKRSIDQVNEEVSAIKVNAEKLAAEMTEVAKNATVLDDALAFFQNRAASEQLTCPLCGETTRTVEAWRSHIQKEIEAKNLAPLQARKQELAKKSVALEKAKDEKVALHKKADHEKAKLLASIKEIELAIARAISQTDDPVAILNAEMNSLDEALRLMQGQVEAINFSLEGFQQALLDLDRFQRIGKAQQEMLKIEAINENDAYKQLKILRKEAERYAEDVELLIDGLKNAVNAAAQQKLTAVQKSISDTFTRLTHRPDYPGLRVSPAGDGYVIELTNTKSDVIKAVPILNHADINCAALSIFLALAGSAQISHRLGIVILDDPSQSLDKACKKNLCMVLAGLCDSRQVIVATADEELRSVVSDIPKNKVSYKVKDWTPSGGPILEAEATSAAHAV
jgi:DNA repair exonuclease SbcCD ATPase subunit